jgi:hypothetical protein
MNKDQSNKFNTEMSLVQSMCSIFDLPLTKHPTRNLYHTYDFTSLLIHAEHLHIYNQK